MATNLGTLTLNLLANTGSYTQGLQRAERQTQQATENMAEDFDLVGRSVNALKGVVAGISVAGVMAFALDVVNAGNEVKKFAQVANAPVEQFQYISKGAMAAGYTLEQFAMINKDVLDRLGEASRGEGEMMDFFTNIAPRIGVTIDQFKNLSGPEVLQKYYDGLEKANLSHPEMITYMEQIADDASLLIPMLKNGGAGFEYWGEKAKQAGAIMSEDMVQDMVTAKENLQVLDLQWQGFKSTLINDAMPVLNTVVQNFDSVVVGGGILAALLSGRVVASYTQASISALANTVATRNKALADYDLAKAELASTAAMVKSMGAINAETAALVANARAKYQSAAAARDAAVASSTMATVGRGALALAGGWVGLGITVASVAAGYLMLKDNGNETNKMLESQGRYAGMATEELNKLSGAQKRAAEKELSNEIMIQSGHLQKAKNDFEQLTESILDSNRGNKEAYRIWAELRTGVITTDEAFAKLNQSDFVTPDQINALTDSKRKVDEHNSSLTKANTELNQIKSNGANAAWGIDELGNAADRTSSKLAALTNKQLEYINQVKSDALEQKYIQNQIALGYSRDRAEHMAAERKAAGMGFSAKDGAMPEAVRQAEAQAWAIKQSEKLREESAKKSEESAKKREADRQKAWNDLERLKEEQAKSRDSISYTYADEFKKFNIEYQKAVQEINKANFGAETSLYLNLAKAKYQFEEEMFLRQITEEINGHKWSEDRKLEYFFETQREIVQNSGKYNDELKQLKIDALKEQQQVELDQLKLARDQRISDAGQLLRTELQNTEIKYAFEREQILKNSQLTEDERQKRMALSFASEDYQKRQNLNSATAAWGGTFADLTGTGAQYQMEQDRFNKYDESQALFDAQMALAESAAEREAIWRAHNDRMAMIDQDYWGKTKSYQLGMASDVFGGLAGIMLNFVDESSGSYRTLVAIQKGANLASVLMNSITAISAAWASAPFPYNLPAVGMATLETGALQATLQAFTPQGFATGGHIKGQGTGTSDDIPIWASNGEFMIRAAAVEKLGLHNLDYINRTGMLPPRFATGGLINGNIMKTKTISNTPSKGVDYNVMQSQQQQPTVDNNMKVLIFDDRSSYEQEMMGPTGERIFMYHWKRNQSKLSR